ncbi:hypothetical protein [Acinetobacter piscicola]|uniref:hypothetical protein n=1 Tax=Acinetobacter piscicola TaxID=2006115 RepID=UPI00101EF746|nr:hypothetical protein [Acinetobacter piscicola]RYL27213.1 hypothetical protein EWP19_07465 [Acinetobacter piscicola]
MATNLKWFTSNTTYAPQLNATRGSLVDLLDACLVTGFNEKTVTSITKDGDNITLHYDVAHGYRNYQILLLSEFDDANLNGEQQIVDITTNSITIIAQGVSLLTGGKSLVAPVGFEIKYQAPSKRVYKSSDPTQNPFYLRVDDSLDPVWTATYAKFAKVGILEDVEGIELEDIIGHQAPNSATVPHPNWVGTGSGSNALCGWAKWYYAYANGFSQNYADISNQNSGNFTWMLVGDKSGFYFLPSCGNDGVGAPYCFGMFDSFLDGDNFNCMLNATLDRQTASTGYAKILYTGLTWVNINATIVLRGRTQVANHALMKPVPICYATDGNTATTWAMISGKVDILTRQGGAQFSSILLSEGGYLRGRAKWINWLYNARPYANFEVFIKNNIIYMARTVLSDSSSTNGQVVMQIGEL